jgi:hypothetical protein
MVPTRFLRPTSLESEETTVRCLLLLADYGRLPPDLATVLIALRLIIANDYQIGRRGNSAIAVITHAPYVGNQSSVGLAKLIDICACRSSPLILILNRGSSWDHLSHPLSSLVGRNLIGLDNDRVGVYAGHQLVRRVDDVLLLQTHQVARYDFRRCLPLARTEI